MEQIYLMKKIKLIKRIMDPEDLVFCGRDQTDQVEYCRTINILHTFIFSSKIHILRDFMLLCFYWQCQQLHCCYLVAVCLWLPHLGWRIHLGQRRQTWVCKSCIDIVLWSRFACTKHQTVGAQSDSAIDRTILSSSSPPSLLLSLIGGTAQSKNPFIFYFEKKRVRLSTPQKSHKKK